MPFNDSVTENSTHATPTDGNLKDIFLPQLQGQGKIYANSFTEFAKEPQESTKKQLQYVLGIPIIFAIIPAYYGGVQFAYPDYAYAVERPIHPNPTNSFPVSEPNANLQQPSTVITQQLSSTTNDPTFDIDIRNVDEQTIPEKQHMTLQSRKPIANNHHKVEKHPTIGEQGSSNDFIIHFVEDVNVGKGQLLKPAGGNRIVDVRVEESVMRDDDLSPLVNSGAVSDDAIHFIESATEKGDIPLPLELTTRRHIDGLPIKDEELEDGSGVDDRIDPQLIKTLVG